MKQPYFFELSNSNKMYPSSDPKINQGPLSRVVKYLKLFSILAVVMFLATSCYDSKMEWETRDPASRITAAEIPLRLAEKIALYDVLKAYTDINLGVAVDMPTYMEDTTYARLVHENFDEIVVGYHMKHGAMVQPNGEIDFEGVDAFIQKALGAGMTIYGHTLVWHSNQNASYLNGLIAPTIIPGPAGSNILNLAGLKDGSFGGWARNNVGQGITIVPGAGLNSADPAIRLIAGSGTNPWDLQLMSPEIPVISGNRYEVSFYIRSDRPGRGRISFDGLTNNWPWMDWLGTGAAESFATTTSWQQVRFTVNNFTAPSFNISFDLGYMPGVTYFIDVENIVVIDLDALPVEVNLVPNGGFESGDLTSWTAQNAGAGIVIETGTNVFSGANSARMTASATSGNPWDLQLQSDPITLVAGRNYIFSFSVKADRPGRGRVSFPGLSNQWPWMDWTGAGAAEAFNITTTWQQVSVRLDNLTFAAGSSNLTLSFDFGYIPNVVYHLDDIKIVEAAPVGAPSLKSVTIIERTDEEKRQIIRAAMTRWIEGMMTRYRNYIHAWDVVNEPMKENGTLRDGDVAELANDEFYWVKYLGRDYAVEAFRLARQFGKPGDKLFINDFNLEHSPAKLDGLLEYVKYIESQGVTIDGIGTQMHITINTNRDNIVSMFQKLAATGKLIKISELDVQVFTTTPSFEDLMAQAEMYKFVVNKFKEIIPEAQQFGITVWGVNDPNGEGFWLADDAPLLWDHNFNRKVSYKYFANGLAGRDVSEDFSGLDFY